MPHLLTLDCVSAQTPERRPLFAQLNLSITAERVGLVGRNGAGKSTLLRIIAGDLPPASGSVRRAGSIGSLTQDWPEHVTLADALGVAGDIATLRRIIAGVGSDSDFQAADWTLEPRLDAALADVGLPALDLDRTIGSLSGGERTRIGIARLRIAQPDFLLLDEPTNNLDAAGRLAVRSLIEGWPGGVLVASHDRELLERMDRIVELTPVGVRNVAGGWSSFAAARDAERGQATAELERAEAGVRHAESSAQRAREVKERRDKAGRAFAAKGSEPKILLGAQAERAQNSGARGRRLAERQVSEAAARAQAARARVEVLTPLSMALPPSGLPTGATVLTLDEVTIAFAARRLGPWSLQMRGPERIAISGANGTGKSTLLKIAAGHLRASGGTVSRVEGRVAMLDQHVAVLDRDATILANFRRINPTLGDRDAYAACARFAFRNRDASQQVATLSGGERLRAGLACILAGERPPWLLILDEPTNHLDIESVELLEEALRAYDGALLVVSHDPAFLRAVGVDREIALDRAE